VKLTEEGKRLIRIAEPVSRRVDERILEALPLKQREQFLDDLAVIVETVSRMAPDPLDKP
jgi:DNA-binding MarR family transcriptional regulator